MNKKLSLLRLQKETADLQKNPIENVIVVREGDFNFHFCLHNLHPPYSGGFYHGVLQLHEEYPLRAPKLIFYTPSGRFQTNTPICTSFTNFHQETWTAAWNVRTLIVATISFMYSEQPSHGCRKDSEIIRKSLAASSRHFNLKSPLFLRVFQHKLPQMPLELKQQNNSSQLIQTEQLRPQLEEIMNLNEQGNNNLMNGQRQIMRERKKKIAIFVLIILIVWAVM